MRTTWCRRMWFETQTRIANVKNENETLRYSDTWWPKWRQIEVECVQDFLIVPMTAGRTETLSPVRGQGSGFSRTEQSQTPLPGTQCPSTVWLCGYFDESSSKSPLYLDMATPNSLTSPPSPSSAQNRKKHLLTDLFLHYELGSVSHTLKHTRYLSTCNAANGTTWLPIFKCPFQINLPSNLIEPPVKHTPLVLNKSHNIQTVQEVQHIGVLEFTQHIQLYKNQTMPCRTAKCVYKWKINCEKVFEPRNSHPK